MKNGSSPSSSTFLTKRKNRKSQTVMRRSGIKRKTPYFAVYPFFYHKPALTSFCKFAASSERTRSSKQRLARRGQPRPTHLINMDVEIMVHVVDEAKKSLDLPPAAPVENEEVGDADARVLWVRGGFHQVRVMIDRSCKKTALCQLFPSQQNYCSKE